MNKDYTPMDFQLQTPREVLAWATQPGWVRVGDAGAFHEFGVSTADAQALYSWFNRAERPLDGKGWVPRLPVIAAHARAQIDRESAPVAPSAPMTLDAMRDAAKGLGYRLVHESGYEAPASVLAWLEARDACDRADDARDAAVRKVGDPDRAVVADRVLNTGATNDFAFEIARLRALGVTPAVLS